MEKKTLKGRLDYTAMIIPLLGVVLLCVLFMIMPAKSSYIIQMIRGFLGNDCGIYYAMLGVGIFACSLYIAFSKYGKIKLGKDTDKPIYSSFNWGVMIFTSTMAADILFYSLWCTECGEKKTYLLSTVPLVLIVAMKYSLNIEKEGTDGDPTDTILGDKILLLLIALLAIMMFIILYIL